MAKLNEMIKNFRLSINQSIEALALLMQMQPEEYAELENEWIPPDDLLQRLCTLFEWNYHEVRQIAQQSASPARPSSGGAAPGGKALEFHEQLIEARLSYGQNPEGVATLLGIPVEYYLTFEAGEIPPDDLLRKICSLFGWNYNQVRQRLINRTASALTFPRPMMAPGGSPTEAAKTEEVAIPENTESPPTLGEQLYEARISADQTIEGIALLLQIPSDYYEQIEQGLVFPDEDTLRRISSLFQWNYRELQQQLQKSSYQYLQPAVTQLEGVQESHMMRKLAKIQKDIASGWNELTKSQQESLLSQLELIRDTMERWKLNR